jgi:glucose repression mediator protein
MQDDLQKAYSAYQQALYLLPHPKVRPILVLMSFGPLVRCL